MNRTAWILAGLFVVIVVVIIFALGDEDEPGETTTTTTAAITSTSPTATTVSGAGPTTTTGGDTTTSLPPTTTTIPASTTTVGVEGNWSDTPLVVTGFGALGWWDGSGWVQVESGTALPVAGGEDYQVAFVGLEATISGGGPTTLCEPLDNPGVELENELVLGDWPGPLGVAVSAPWILVPHLVEEIEDDGTYAAFASELLAERGLDVPEPAIKQLLQVDLEGDGVNEVLVVAEDVSAGLFAEDGDYSIAFMRRTVQGDVRTAILGESVVVTAASPVVNSYSVGAVADLNGDGRMEVVLSTAYYEGVGVDVWEYVDDDLGLTPQISAGCGV
ncbi:MAG TPA: hypothetical protein VLA91_16920 [Acidimicrobiia bacterium]|nr:hypothetical protein [Acidimicrobiia bacterium]